MRHSRFLVVFGGLVLFCMMIFTSHAEIHKWVDENGKIHYGDRAPASKNVKALDISVETFSNVEVRPLDEEAMSVLEREIDGKTKKKKVVMYSTEWCGVCKKAKKYFNANSIPFREYDIEKDEKRAREFKKLKGRGVPLILVGKQRMSGFSASSFEKLYKN